MSIESVVTEFIEATDAKDFARYDRLLSDNVIAHFPGQTLDRQQLEENEVTFARAFPDVARNIHELVVQGDKVVARFSLRGTHQGEFAGIAATGRGVATTAIVIYRVVDGRIVEQWVEADFQGLMAQLE